MKKYILILFPILGLNAQVTIGPDDSNSSAMLNITMPNSVFIVPVGDKDKVNTSANSLQANNAVPEGSFIYHRATDRNDISSGIFFRVADTSVNNRSNSTQSADLKWKPFSSRRKTYVYNNIKTNINEDLLGYQSADFANSSIPENCFKWDSQNPNNPDDFNPLANGHVYCLIDNATYGTITDVDGSTACNGSENESSTRSTEIVSGEITRIIGLSGSDVVGWWSSDRYRTYTFTVPTGTIVKKQTDIVTTSYSAINEKRDSWGCAFATAKKDNGYLATITSKDEYDFILEKLNSISALSTNTNVAIGLRNIFNNEGDRKSYSSSATKMNKKMWINGEINAVNWLNVTTSNALPVDSPNSVGTLTQYKNKTVKRWKETKGTYSTTEKFEIRLKCSLASNSTTCNFNETQILNLKSSWDIRNTPRITYNDLLESKEETTYSNPDSNFDCGSLVYDTSSSIKLGSCNFGSYPKILVEYNK